MNLLLRTLNQPTGLRFKPRFFFSISKQQMIEMHEAILASKIIKMIKSGPRAKINKKHSEDTQNQTIVFPSLRSQLILMIKQYSPTNEENNTSMIKNDDTQIIQTAKNNMLKFFDGGVWVSSDLCNQQRFFAENRLKKSTQSLNGKQDNNSGEKIPKSSQKIKGMKKLTFCPTYLITGQIFRIIISQIRYLLITGHFGIGKTYSFMLYHLLSDIIYRYFHKYKKYDDQISNDIPKLVYFSTDIEQFGQQSLNLMNQIIAKQCYELTSVHSNYDFIHINHNQISLKKFYQQKNIDLRLIIDQIHVIASALRNHKNLVLIKQQLLKSDQFKKASQLAQSNPNRKYLSNQLINEMLNDKSYDVQQISQRYHSAIELLRIVRVLRIKFGRALYLSSRTIQQSQMQKLNLNGQHTHERIQTLDMNFMQFSKTPQNSSDLAEFFVLLLEIRYKKLYSIDNLSERQKNMVIKIKQIIQKNINQRNLMFLPYTIRLVIFGKSSTDSTKSSSQSNKNFGFQQIIKRILNQDNSEQLLEKLTNQLINKINNRSKFQLSELIQRFLNKSETTNFQQVKIKKKLLLLKLLYAIKQKIHLQKKNPQLRKTTNIVINSQDIFNPNINVPYSEVIQNLNKNIAYYLDDKKFYLSVDQEILVQVLEELEDSLLQALLESNEKIYSLISTQVARGLFIQSLIIKCLSIKDTKLTLNIFQGRDRQNRKKFLLMSQTKSKLYFNSIPLINSKNYNNFSFLNPIIKKIQKLNGDCYLLMPTRQKLDDTYLKATNILQKKIDEKSKKIDFVLTQYFDEKFDVVAFDVTIDQSEVQNKIIHFIYEYSNFNDKQTQKLDSQNQVKVELSYMILVPQLNEIKNIKWEILLKKAISLLKSDYKQEKQREDQKYSLEKIARLQQRIAFLQSLNNDENLSQRQYSLKIKRSQKLKTLLTNVSVYSFFDAQIENVTNKSKISLYKRLLQHAKNQFKSRPK